MSVRLPVCEMSSIPAAPSPTSLALRCLCCSPLCLRSESGTRVRASARKENNEREMNLEENETLAACACDSFQLICLFCPPPSLSLTHTHSLPHTHSLTHSHTHSLVSHMHLVFCTQQQRPLLLPRDRDRDRGRAKQGCLNKKSKHKAKEHQQELAAVCVHAGYR